MYTLENLPAELLLAIASSLNRSRDINSFARVSRRFFNTLNGWLYRYDAFYCGMCALDWAATHGAIHTAKKSIDARSVDPLDPGLLEDLYDFLFIAAKHGHTNIVSLILSQEGVDVNFISIYKETPLSVASQEGHLELVKFLLSTEGIDINLDTGRRTALIMACRTGQFDVVQRLLDEPGIEVDTSTRYGRTPLFEAIDCESVAVAKYLLQRPGLHVNVNAMNVCYDKLSPAHRMSLLIKAAERNLSEIVELLLAAPDIWVNHRDSRLRTALHEAAIVGSEKMVKDLLEHQAEPDPVDYFNETPLFMAAEIGHISVVKLLLDAGAEPNHVCDNGFTPLAAARENGNGEVVQMLLDTGRVFLSSLEKVNIDRYIYSRRVALPQRGPPAPRPDPIQYSSDGLAVGPRR